jgi:hypothetical protein
MLLAICSSSCVGIFYLQIKIANTLYVNSTEPLASMTNMMSSTHPTAHTFVLGNARGETCREPLLLLQWLALLWSSQPVLAALC